MAVTRPVRAVFWIAGLVITLVIAAVAAVLLVSPKASHFVPGSPEDTVQRYLQTYQAGDFATAYGFFSSQAQAQLPADQYVMYARAGAVNPLDSTSRIVVDRVQGDAQTVRVYLTIENESGSAFRYDRWSYQAVIPLVRQTGEWKINQLMLGTSPAPVLPVSR